MTAAKVHFLTMDFYAAPTMDEGLAGPGQEARFGFLCPKSRTSRCESLIIAGAVSGVERGKGTPVWDWDGNRDEPTFTPSINCKDCWHGYIRKGRCVDTNGNDEPEPA